MCAYAGKDFKNCTNNERVKIQIKHFRNNLYIKIQFLPLPIHIVIRRCVKDVYFLVNFVFFYFFKFCFF